MALLDALRALSSLAPPASLPGCDLGVLGDVLVSHGLAPIASHHLESTHLGASVPESFRERLLSVYQGILTDNFNKLIGLRRALRELEVPVVLLDAAAYLDWLYPHMAFRPVSDLRVAVRGEDGARFAEQARRAGLELVRTEREGRAAVFSDGNFELSLQEGLWPGGPLDAPLFERARPYPLFGRRAARPSPEDALLATIADQSLVGLLAPLVTYVDVRELLRLPLDAGYVKARAGALGLSRALHGSMLLAAHFFPEVEGAADALLPSLGAAERLAVEKVVETARDPSRLRHLRGVDAAARLVVAPH